MRQMFPIGERSGRQAGQFSTRTLLLRIHAVVIAAVCGLHCPPEIHKAFPEIDVIWRGAYVALKPLYTPLSIHNAFQNMQAAFALFHRLEILCPSSERLCLPKTSIL